MDPRSEWRNASVPLVQTTQSLYHTASTLLFVFTNILTLITINTNISTSFNISTSTVIEICIHKLAIFIRLAALAAFICLILIPTPLLVLSALFITCSFRKLRSTALFDFLLLYRCSQCSRQKQTTCCRVYFNTCRTSHYRLFAFCIFQPGPFFSNCFACA